MHFKYHTYFYFCCSLIFSLVPHAALASIDRTRHYAASGSCARREAEEPPDRVGHRPTERATAHPQLWHTEFAPANALQLLKALGRHCVGQL
jgi:hypothetical protein